MVTDIRQLRLGVFSSGFGPESSGSIPDAIKDPCGVRARKFRESEILWSLVSSLP